MPLLVSSKLNEVWCYAAMLGYNGSKYKQLAFKYTTVCKWGSVKVLMVCCKISKGGVGLEKIEKETRDIIIH